MKPRLINGVFNSNHFGYDPYNSVGAKEIANTIVSNFPLPDPNSDTRTWKFRPLPYFLRTQAE